MTRRIRQLLDDAVADLEPGNPDPVATVLRRGRSQRRRAMAAGALAVAVLLGGGLALGRSSMEADRVPAASADPPTPHLVGDTVVAGALRLPVPAGWRVLTNDPKRPCGDLDKTVLLVTTDNRGCQYAPVEVYGTRSVTPGGTVVLSATGDNFEDPIVTSPVPVTLHGGEPGWLQSPTDDAEQQPSSDGRSFWNVLILPWSQVIIQLRQDGPAQQKIIDSMSSEPTEAGRLVLPATAAEAVLTAPDADGRNTRAGHGRTTDRATIAAVLELLGAQESVVDNNDACARPAQHSARLALNGSLPSPGPAGSSTNPTTVVISLGDTCQEAVSSGGGRVRLTDAAVRDLKRLFGIGA